MAAICVFGDSTAWGAYDTDAGGWVNILWLHCAENAREIDVYNLSIPGSTIEMILDRFEAEAKIRGSDTLVFQTGGNEAAYDKDTKEHVVTPEIFEIKIREVIARAREVTNNIIFVGFNNCDESKTLPVAWCNLCYTNKYIEDYNNIMKKVCVENSIKFLDVFGLLEDDDLDDGLHPNTRGHQKIFNFLKSKIL